jgi:hypothetical protein
MGLPCKSLQEWKERHIGPKGVDPMFAARRLFVAVAFVLVASALYADFIDDFTQGPYVLGNEGTPMPYVVSQDCAGTPDSILGGTRRVTLNRLAGTSGDPDIHGGMGVGATYNSSWDSSATWTLEYGIDNDMSADLTGDDNAIFVELTLEDMCPTGRLVPLTVTVVSDDDSTGQGRVEMSVTKNLVCAGIYGFLFSEFAGVDFSDIDYVKFEFDCSGPLQEAVDFRIMSLGTDRPTGGDIPEPATMSLLALGVAGAVVVRRRRKK